MARFIVTASAMTSLRELLVSCGPDPHVIVLYWTGPQADVHRLADGATSWSRVSEGQWNIGLDTRQRHDEARLEAIGDIEFVVKEFPPSRFSIDGRTLDFVAGQFVVR